jgi:hypothetical protein
MCRWEDNIKINFKEMGCTCADWINLTLDRDQCCALCVHSNEPLGSIRGKFLDLLSDHGIVRINPESYSRYFVINWNT